MDRNIELITEVAAGKKPYLSTSQACMVGIALCRPALLDEAKCTVKESWRRIDSDQLSAILKFHQIEGPF